MKQVRNRTTKDLYSLRNAFPYVKRNKTSVGKNTHALGKHTLLSDLVLIQEFLCSTDLDLNFYFYMKVIGY